MEEYTYVGKPTKGITWESKVKGEAKFTDDLRLPGMLEGKLLRSPFAHAKILNIDTSKAEKLPGVKAVITEKDTPGRKRTSTYWPKGEEIPFHADEYLLAKDRVRHVGEAVAAVAAIDEDTAEEALDLIKVEYEELPV